MFSAAQPCRSPLIKLEVNIKTRTNIIVIVIMFLSMMTFKQSNAQTANSPWPCLQQNPQHTGQSAYAGPEHPALAWKFKAGAGISGSPVIDAEGVIYITSTDGFFYAIYPNGIEKWHYYAENVFPKGTPVLSIDSTIYVGCNVKQDEWTYGPAELLALNSDGSFKWSRQLGTGDQCTDPVLGNDGSIYLGAFDDLEFEKEYYAFHAYYPNGGQKWIYPVDPAINYIGTPAIRSDGVIVFSTWSSNTFAFDEDGNLKWKNNGFTDQYGGGPLAEWGWPIISLNLYTLLGSEGITIWNTNGNLINRYDFPHRPASGTMSAPVLSNDQTIYFARREFRYFGEPDAPDSLYAIDINCRKKWAYELGYNISISAPLIDSEGIIWFCDNNGKIYAFESNGSLKWTENVLGGSVSSKLALGTDGTLYLGSSDGYLYAFTNIDPSITPDLYVSQITFNPIDGINVETKTNIYADIEEISGQGPVRCKLMFYHTAVNANNIIGSAYAFIPKGQKGRAAVEWNTKGMNYQTGEYNIIAVISNSNPPESNTLNNQLQTTYRLLKSIQKQMSAGSDTIWVEPGTYTESISMSGNKVVKSILGTQRTIINGNGADNVVQFNYLDSTAVLDGFTIMGGDRGVSFERGGGIVRNCIIKKNQTGIWNIGSMVYTDPIIENNIITENTQYAMDTNNSWALLNKNTIVNNTAGVKGYGFYSPSPTIVNCILWNNNDDLVETASATYSCIQNGDPGTGNISSDPSFVDVENWDYHLQQGSPCINAGHPDPAFNDPDGSRADMGAFYYSSSTSVHSPKESTLPEKYRLAQNYPNPFNPLTTIEYQLPQDTQVSLKIFNIAGELVKSLIEEKQSAGFYEIQWDGRDENGNSVAGGLYLYHLKADGFSQSNKMVLIR